MQELPTYYTTLFNAVTDAIEELKAKQYPQALLLLIRAQQEAEELYAQGTGE